ncbi:TadE/TadG family type IV pilus assembly protein [Hyalangium gracile]|uniref:TadE/TadG family type IV pilus assembly protein n=1 Tax=Hyalangium gracile TaxID=394092 RepID=UPI001CCD65AA|nr:pilus assembly protein [Hyalangium gracile]
MRRDERGQAMVIGVIALLVLCVTVMTSVSIGHGVYSKIKLQDAADAQAYSLAVKEARAYNFLAYTNRAMIVHYSAMLTVMSYVSHAVYLDKTIRVAASYLKAIPVIGGIFAAVETAIKTWKTVVETVSRGLVPILTALNVALWLAQEAMLVGTVLDLITFNETEVIAGTDKNAMTGYAMDFDYTSTSGWEALAANVTTNFSNAKNFLHAIDDGPHSSESTIDWSDPTGLGKRSKLMKKDNALSDPDMAKYRLLMGNLANAVRREWTAKGKGPILIGRDWDFHLCVVVGELRINKTADSQIKSFSENFENNRKDQLYASDDISIDVRIPCFNFLSGWDTVFELRFRAAADARDGYHQEYGRRKTDNHHPWLGITPFLTSDTSFMKPWQYHFSYPCSLVILTKDMIAKQQIFNMQTEYMKGSGTYDENGVLDLTWDMVGGDSPSAQNFREKTGGMMALAVGRAIYHRPGDWKEEPNFFNPVWTARLAPAVTHWEEESMKVMISEWGKVEAVFGLNY